MWWNETNIKQKLGGSVQNEKVDHKWGETSENSFNEQATEAKLPRNEMRLAILGLRRKKAEIGLLIKVIIRNEQLIFLKM